MSGVPVETVVELLIANIRLNEVDQFSVRMLDSRCLVAYMPDELRTKVREYVETLVRKDGE
jgi:hypothetical protein